MPSGQAPQTIGYRYFLGVHFVACHGVADAVTEVIIDKKSAWTGLQSAHGAFPINQPGLFGGEDREGGIVGSVTFAPGAPDQVQPYYLVTHLGADVPAYRGVVSFIAEDCNMGTNPYLKPWAFRVQRIHKTSIGTEQWYDAKAAIPVYGGFGEGGVVDVDLNGLVNAGLSSYPGITVNAEPDAVLTVTFPDDGVYQAVSFWPSDDSDLAAGNPWLMNFTVTTSAGDTEYLPEAYPTIAEARAAAQAATITLTGYSSYTFWIQDIPISDNRGGVSLRISGGAASQVDMNPAHIIRECLTDSVWGMGYADSAIDDASFTLAADTLYSERMGISIEWNQQKTIEEFIDLIKKHINASTYVDRKTGKWKIKLIRNDYDEESLPVFDQSNIELIDNFVTPTPGELISSVTVNYWNARTNKTASLTFEDIALAEMQETTINTTVNYDGFTNPTIAQRAALRDLATLSSPLSSCVIHANSDAEDLNPGDCFVLNWPEWNISGMVMRVARISIPDGRSKKYRISCTQDVFDLPEPAFATTPESEWVDTSIPPVPMTKQLVVEASYYELVLAEGQTAVDNGLLANPDAGYFLVTGERPGTAVNARLASDSGGGYVTRNQLVDFCATAKVGAEIGYMDTIIPYTDGYDTGLVIAGLHLIINGEVMKIVDLNTTAGEIEVVRGVIDTVPAQHAVGDDIYFYGAYAVSDEIEYVTGETVNVKVMPTTAQGTLDISAATAVPITFNQRAYRPYPPGNLQIEGQYFPAAVMTGTGVDLTWAHRDRTQQTAGYIGFTTGNIGPEAGVTYEIEISGDGGAPMRSVTGISAASYSYATADEQTDNGGDLNNALSFQLISKRDGVESWQGYNVTVNRADYGYSYGMFYGGI